MSWYPVDPPGTKISGCNGTNWAMVPNHTMYQSNTVDQLRIKLDEIKGHPLYSINQGLFCFPAQSQIAIKMEIHTGSPWLITIVEPKFLATVVK